MVPDTKLQLYTMRCPDYKSTKQGALEHDTLTIKLNWVLQPNNEIDDDEQDVFSQAKHYFQQSSASYTPIASFLPSQETSAHIDQSKRKRPVAYTPPKNLSIALAPIMRYFDSNTPFHCQANALYNSLILGTDNPQIPDSEIIQGLIQAKKMCGYGDAFIKREKFIQPLVQKTNATKTKKLTQTLLKALQPISNNTDIINPRKKLKLSTLPSGSRTAQKSRSKKHLITSNDTINARKNIKFVLPTIETLYESINDAFLKILQKPQLKQIRHGTIKPYAFNFRST